MLNQNDTIIGACVLVTNPDGEVLVISRKKDTTNWGIPGGSIKQGESVEQAAVRELFEETHLHITPDMLSRDVFLGWCKSDTNKPSGIAVTYLYRCPSRTATPEYTEGFVKWSHPSLLVGEGCVFSQYNKRMLAHFGISTEKVLDTQSKVKYDSFQK